MKGGGGREEGVAKKENLVMMEMLSISTIQGKHPDCGIIVLQDI